MGMETELKQHLLRLVEAFAEASAIGVTTAWRRAINDPAFHDRLQSDKTITLRTYDRATAWFAENWPDHVDWPVDVPRPKVAALEVLS